MEGLELTTAQANRIRAFRPIAEAVLDRAVDEAECLQILLNCGHESALAQILRPVKDRIHIQAMLQLAVQYPREICAFVAARIALGADMRRRPKSSRKKRRIGFRR